MLPVKSASGNLQWRKSMFTMGDGKWFTTFFFSLAASAMALFGYGWFAGFERQDLRNRIKEMSARLVSLEVAQSQAKIERDEFWNRAFVRMEAIAGQVGKNTALLSEDKSANPTRKPPLK
jgi:hypothetical protein